MRYAIFAFTLLLAINISLFNALAPHRTLAVSVLPVGKGDAVLVRSPGGRTLLIDTGANASVLRALGETLSFWQRRIDFIVLARPDEAGAGGLPEVLDRYSVDALLRTNERGTKNREMVIASALSGINAPRQLQVERGMRLAFHDGVSVDILSPDSRFPSADDAAVLRITYGMTSFVIDERKQPYNAIPGENSVTLSIAADTPAATFISNGKDIRTRPR